MSSYRLRYYDTADAGNLDVHATYHGRHRAADDLDQAHHYTEQYLDRLQGGMVACYRLDAAGVYHHVFTYSRPDRRPKEHAA